MQTSEIATEPNVTYNWNISRNFPKLNKDLVDRSHLLETIASILTEDSPIVFLEGNDGSGSTTISAQFCKKYSTNSFSLFIRPVSRFSYSLDYLRFMLFEQFYWFLESRTFDKDVVDVSLYETYLQKLRRNKSSSIFYFVIDGLHHIPKENQNAIEEIIKEVIPIGAGSNFRFLISGSQSELGKYTARVRSKTYQLASFSITETDMFFTDMTDLSKEEVIEIRKLCQGIPGRLASVKRLLNNSMSLDEILESDPSKYPEFIELEFNALDTFKDSQKIIVAIIVFGKRALSLSELTALANTNATEIEHIISKCLFLQVDKNTDLIEFLSDSHRRFAERKLKPFQVNAIESHISYLKTNPQSSATLVFLPTYYQSLNQQEAIIDLLSLDHYTKLFESTQSIDSLRHRAELGFKSAISLKQFINVFKFSTHKNLFTSVSDRDEIESEISALVTLNQLDKALTLANATASKVDKLALLASYAKKVTQESGAIEAELANHILQLTESIDFTECGDKAVDIATDVLFFNPDLAISIVEAARKESAQKQSKENALAHLSITASLNNNATSNKSNAIHDKVIQKISDEALQKMTSTVVTLVSKQSVEELKKTIEDMQASHRLYFLQAYISIHLKSSSILDVVEYALDFMISDSLYIPKSRDLAEIVKPLPFTLDNPERLKKLIIRCDSQLGLVQSTAVSKYLVIFQMSLARAQIHFDSVSALARIESIYYEVSSIKNLETLIECYAILLNELIQIDPKYKIEENFHYIQIVQADLSASIKDVLKQTANHYSVIKGVLDVLAGTDPMAAIQLSSTLNTVRRRDEAYRHVVRMIVSNKFSDLRKSAVLNALDSIEDPAVKSAAILSFANILVLNEDKENWAETLVGLKHLVYDPRSKLKLIVKILEISIEAGKSPSLDEFIAEFDSLKNEIDSKIDLVDLYFKAVPPLAKLDRNISLQFYDKGNDVKKSLKFNTPKTLRTFQACVHLLLKTMSPIMKHEVDLEEFISRLDRLIQMLPSARNKAAIYNELAVRAWCIGKGDICNNIVRRYCSPLLEAYKTSNITLYQDIKQIMFPSFHCFHSDTALNLLDDIYTEDRDDVLSEVAIIRIRKLTSNTPYHQESSDKFKISNEDAHDIIKILRELKVDSNIFGVIDSLVLSMADKVNKTSFTAQQKADIAQQLSVIVNEKLPNLKNIKHSGYKIAALAKIYELSNESRKQWDSLLTEVETIDNIADKGFVYVQIALSMPPKYQADKTNLLNKALILFEQIPSITDKLIRLEGYSRHASGVAKNNVKEALKSAFKLTMEIEESSEAIRHQREILNIADSIDSKFSDELIDLVDDDPARIVQKQAMKHSADQIKTKRELANAKDVHDASKINKEFLSESSWLNMAALLANKLETKSEEVMHEYVAAAAEFSLDDSYPVLSWYIENAAKRFVSSHDFSKKILPIAEVLFLTTEMAVTFIANNNNLTLKFKDVDPKEDGLILKGGTRDEAINYIRSWLRTKAQTSLTYCDPYFGPDDIDFLRLVVSECPSCNVAILTSKKQLEESKKLDGIHFTNAWASCIDQDPPTTEIIAIDSADTNKKAGIHDRWILTVDAGLRLGTSFNSLGTNKLSEISELSPSKVIALESELSKYVQKDRYISGNKVNYTVFYL